MTKRTVFVTGYPYARDAYRRTFDHISDEDMRIRFILPCSWPIKGGQVIFRPEKNERTTLIPAWFSHSHYPLIGGILKGWMPAMPFVLFRHAHRGDILFTALEPTLLSALYNGVAAKLMGMKHVLFTWENIPYEKKHGRIGLVFKNFVLTLNRWFSDGIVCGNPKADEIMADLGFKRRAVIPISGIDTERFRPRSRPESYAGVSIADKTTLCYAGALDDRKGLSYLLDAFQQLVSKGRAVHLFLAGAGPMQSELQDRVRETELKGHVTLLPWLSPDELAEMLAATDIFIYPSTSRGGWSEQFGYVVAEALASGKPVIVSTSGALPWVVKNRQSGIVVPERNVEAIKDAVELLIEDQALRIRMGSAASRDAAQRFGYVPIASQYVRFIRSLLS